MEKEFEVKVYKNRTNKQFILIPMKKHLSKEIIKSMNNDKVIGLKLKIIKVLKEPPKAKTIIDWKDDVQVKGYNTICQKYKQLIKKEGGKNNG